MEAFDKVNSQDPFMELVNGEEMPKELLYSQRMTEMLLDFYPTASETLQLAARCQHIRRWAIPRDDYPMDRKGYLEWRTALKKFHGKLAAEIMAENGYGEEAISKVDDLLNKRRLKTDPEVQALEDVVCLVFLKYYFDPFIAKHKEEEIKLIDIVQKTWRKMSPKGHDAALAMSHSTAALAIVQKALQD